MNIPYLLVMRQVCLFLLSCYVGTLFGQFIPQPSEYNPDENSDGFISVVDLQGLLALYGNPFFSPDSLEIVTLQLDSTNGVNYPFIEGFVYGDQSTWVIPEIPEEADIVYFDIDNHPWWNDDLEIFVDCPSSNKWYVSLPEGNSPKVILLYGFTREDRIRNFTDECGGVMSIDLEIIRPPGSYQGNIISEVGRFGSEGQFMLLYRDHFGLWRSRSSL